MTLFVLSTDDLSYIVKLCIYRAEFLRQFLLYNHVLTQEEIEAAGEEGVPECPPTLEQFKEQVKLHNHEIGDFCPVAVGFINAINWEFR